MMVYEVTRIQTDHGGSWQPFGKRRLLYANAHRSIMPGMSDKDKQESKEAFDLFDADGGGACVPPDHATGHTMPVDAPDQPCSTFVAKTRTGERSAEPRRSQPSPHPRQALSTLRSLGPP